MRNPWAWLALLWLAAGIAFTVEAGTWAGAKTLLAGLAAGVCLGRWRELAASRRAAPATAEAARDARSRRRGQLDAVLASVTEGVLLVDRDGVVRSVSPVAVTLLGVRFDPEAEARLSSLVPWPQLEQAVTACLADGKARSFEGACALDAQLTLAVSVTAWRRDGELAGAVIVLDDLSRLRRLEAHRRDFVANVSHELKTPLAAIQGFVETMLDDAEMPAATQRRFLERIAVQSARLATLVGDLLTLSRLDDDHPGTYAAEPCDLGMVTRDVVVDLLPLAERKPVRIAVETPVGPVPVAAQREELRQILSNLVDNAIKYTPAGGNVTVRLRGGTRAELEIQDTGIGLSPDDQERVFERFYRVDKARSRELGGTGLGLSIVKNTVRSLGGAVGVRSELGRGSTFWVHLPVAAANQASAAR